MPPAYPGAMQTFSFTRFMHILIISVLLLRSETRVFDVCLAIWYSFIPEKCCVPVFQYVVKPWNFTHRRSISTPSCVSQSFCLVLHHIIFGGVTRWNRLKLVEAARTHTHTHTHHHHHHHPTAFDLCYRLPIPSEILHAFFSINFLLRTKITKLNSATENTNKNVDI